MNALYNNMNDDLSNLINWFKANMLSLNIAKTNYLLFPSSQFVNVGEDMKLYADADEIIRNECCTFLGIISDDKLGWLDHTNTINIKLSRYLYILNSVTNMLPNYILRQLYFTTVQPYLTYGIILWGSTYQSYLKRTVILQKKAIICICIKLTIMSTRKPLFYASNVLNINFTYLLEVSKFMHDYTRRTRPTPLLNFFSSNPTVHQHNTRQVLDPHFSIIYNYIADKYIIHRGPRIWSNIPQVIKECVNKNSFTKLLKRHFVTKQEYLS